MIGTTVLHVTSPRWLVIFRFTADHCGLWLHRGCALGWTDTASALGRCNNLPTPKLLILKTWREAAYRRLVSRCCRNCPSWLHARTSKFASESMWMTRLIASKRMAFFALECCTFFDLGGSCALFSIVSMHSVSRFLTVGSSATPVRHIVLAQHANSAMLLELRIENTKKKTNNFAPTLTIYGLQQ